MATLTFSTLGSHTLAVFNSNNQIIQQAKVGDKIRIELKAALNINWDKKDKGWVEVSIGKDVARKVIVIETGKNSGVFTTDYTVPEQAEGKILKVSYGYLGFDKVQNIQIIK